MTPFKTRMLASTVIPVAVALGGGTATLFIGGAVLMLAGPVRAACNPCAAENPCAAANPCNPCAAKNPCAAANPCNPCAARPVAANPCNPCAANPCAASVSSCMIPRLAQASLNNPCNPCAAQNPCAAASPCSPCAAGATVELTDAEAARAYDCLIGQMHASYAKSGNKVAASYQGWQRYSRVAYQSATHGGRFVQNYANPRARAYGAFEKAGKMPVGATLAKDSFTIDSAGRASPGPMFIMEKMAAGFNPEGGDWKYTMIMPNGSVFGETRGKNTAGMQFCIECHIAVGEEQDSLMFLPDEYRVR